MGPEAGVGTGARLSKGHPITLVCTHGTNVLKTRTLELLPLRPQEGSSETTLTIIYQHWTHYNGGKLLNQRAHSLG